MEQPFPVHQRGNDSSIRRRLFCQDESARDASSYSIPVPSRTLVASASFHHSVFDAVHQRLPTCLDNVLRDADGAPAVVAVAGVEEHARDCARSLVLVENAHFIIDQMDPRKLFHQFRISCRQQLSEGYTQGVNRAVSLSESYRQLAAAVTFEDDLGLADNGALALLHDDTEVVELDYWLVQAQLPP